MFGLVAHGVRAHHRARADATTTRNVTLEQRQQWADAIRGYVRPHTKAWAAIRSKHRRVSLSGNRRSAKTTSVGHEVTARLVERDHYIAWVFVEHLAEFTRNWVARGYAKGADMRSAPQTGMRQQLELYGVPYSYQRYDETRYYGITFPLWGSKLEIHPAEHASQVEAARGGACHVVWLDEAQKMREILAILEDVAGPAGKDFRAQFFMTGTPGEEVGSYFHRVVSGDNTDWEPHDITSADNPFFGATYAERYERSIMEDLRDTMSTTNMTRAQLDQLAGLNEDEFTVEHLASQPWIDKIPASVRREYLRLWVAPSTEMIYPQDHIPVELRYWADWAPSVTAAALGEGVQLAEVLAQPARWTERFRQLPKMKRGAREESKIWHAVLCQDLGQHDPMALTLQVWANHEALYEFDSAKIKGLRGDEMLEALKTWALAAKKMANIRLWGVVIDDDGGATPAMVDDWRHKLAPLLPGISILDAYKPKIDIQVLMLNAERARGMVRVLRNGPIDLEEQHLRREQWDPERPGKKRKQDKHRQVMVAVTDGLGRKQTIRATPGNDALDARRYGWWKATRLLGTMENPDAKPPRMTDGEWLELQIQRKIRGGRARR